MMVDPSYDISHIDKKLLRFLKYTLSGYWSDDIIPLAFVKIFGDIKFPDNMLEEEEIHTIVTKYESSDGIVHQIMKGQCVNFALAALYVRYCFDQYKTNKNARNPDKWTKKEYLEW